VDAIHKIHNQNLGNFVSATLGVNSAHTHSLSELVILGRHCARGGCLRLTSSPCQELALHYPQVFRVNTPAVAVLKCQYDWNGRYKPISNPLSGFTKTKADPFTVQAWRIKRGASGLIETTWKPVASLNAPWLGMDGQPGTAGFCKLRGRPVVRPCVFTYQFVF
jgi:hypothetical protein